MRIFIVGFENDRFWCSNGTPCVNSDNSKYAFEYSQSLRSAQNEASLLMMKHPIKRDMSQAKIVSDTRVGFGMPYLDVPEYIDYDETRKTPNRVWVIEAPTRYQAIKIAKQDCEKNLLSATPFHKLSNSSFPNCS